MLENLCHDISGRILKKNEIDVVVDLGSKLPPIEIKSGTTINSDFFKNLRHWQKVTKFSEKDNTLIYGRGEYLTYQGTQVVPWCGIS